MNLRNKFILNFTIGFSIGMLGCTIITAVMTTNYINDGTTYFCDPSFVKIFGNEIIAFTIQSIISGLYGGICFGSTIIYEIETWSILKTTITHFLVVMFSFFITAFTLKWWSTNDYIINLTILGTIISVYFVIWIIQYIIYKIEISKIQNNIDKFNEKTTK